MRNAICSDRAQGNASSHDQDLQSIQAISMSLSLTDRTIGRVPNSDDTAWSVRHYRARLSGRPEFNGEIPAIQPSLAAVGALGPGAHLFRGYQETMDFALHLHALIDGK